MALFREPILRLKKTQIPIATEIMVRSYRDDLLMDYFFPEEYERKDRMTWFLEKRVSYGLKYGEAYTTTGVEGFVIWLVPGFTVMTFSKIMRSCHDLVLTNLDDATYKRMRKYFFTVLKVLNEFAPKIHWYLYECAYM